jgi:hypothetical protein
MLLPDFHPVVLRCKKCEGLEKTEEYNIYKIGKSVATKEEEGWDDMR